MQQIRVNKTKEINLALNAIRSKKYPILSDSEIIKLLIGQEYNEVLVEPVEILNAKESDEIRKSIAEIDSGKLKAYGSIDELLKALKKD
ncbi:MAG: hypothetical protein WCO33_02340 [bacterium]